MGAVKVTSIVKNGDVLVRCGDIIKTLYADLANTESLDIKNYIRDSIKIWEEYEKAILEEASKHQR